MKPHVHFAATLTHLQALCAIAPRPKSLDARICAITRKFNEEFLLDAYIPQIHTHIDARDFMAKSTFEWNLIEYRLDDKQLEEFEAWINREKPTIVQALNYFAEKSIDVKFRHSDKDASWCVSITGKKDARFNAETTLTNWSDDPIEAMFMALFKATIIFEDGVWKTRKSQNRG